MRVLAGIFASFAVFTAVLLVIDQVLSQFGTVGAAIRWFRYDGCTCRDCFVAVRAGYPDIPVSVYLPEFFSGTARKAQEQVRTLIMFASLGGLVGAIVILGRYGSGSRATRTTASEPGSAPAGDPPDQP